MSWRTVGRFGSTRLCVADNDAAHEGVEASAPFVAAARLGFRPCSQFLPQRTFPKGSSVAHVNAICFTSLPLRHDSGK